MEGVGKHYKRRKEKEEYVKRCESKGVEEEVGSVAAFSDPAWSSAFADHACYYWQSHYWSGI
jgi:hypothetical protein